MDKTLNVKKHRAARLGPQVPPSGRQCFEGLPRKSIKGWGYSQEIPSCVPRVASPPPLLRMGMQHTERFSASAVSGFHTTRVYVGAPGNRTATRVAFAMGIKSPRQKHRPYPKAAKEVSSRSKICSDSPQRFRSSAFLSYSCDPCKHPQPPPPQGESTPPQPRHLC